jgi:hypothetical protein
VTVWVVFDRFSGSFDPFWRKKMIKAHVEWSFTDQPDVYRMCRELREAGCSLGVSTRADGAITLVDLNAARFQNRAWVRELVDARWQDSFAIFSGWRCFRGDLAKEFLKVSPVTVKGYR